MAAMGPRWTTQRARATLGRRGALPTGNGPARPGGRPALEDPRGPLACAKRLRAIEAPDLLEGRDGERSGRGAWEAVRDRPVALQAGREGSLGDAARTGGCDPLDQTGRLDMLRLRLADRASLHR